VSVAPTESPEVSAGGGKSRFKFWARLVLFVLGLLALVTLVFKLGPAQVWQALLGAGPLLPFILLLDVSWLAAEGGAAYLLYGGERKRITRAGWIEATLLHFVTFTVVPVGRASAEIARATLLGKVVGRSRAAATAALMQSFSLMANAMLSLVCLSMVVLAARSDELAWFITLNVLITGAIGLVTYLLLRHVRIGGRLGKRIGRLKQVGPELDQHIGESRRLHLPALGIVFFGRTLQTVQYGVIVWAVVGASGIVDAFTAQGIQLVGRTLGDAVPNQVGVTESAFALGRDALGLGAHPEKAVAIALLARVSNLGMAGIGALVLQFLPKSSEGAAS